jgi:hypothetical protein
MRAVRALRINGSDVDFPDAVGTPTVAMARAAAVLAAARTAGHPDKLSRLLALLDTRAGRSVPFLDFASLYAAADKAAWEVYVPLLYPPGPRAAEALLALSTTAPKVNPQLTGVYTRALAASFAVMTSAEQETLRPEPKFTNRLQMFTAAMEPVVKRTLDALHVFVLGPRADAMVQAEFERDIVLRPGITLVGPSTESGSTFQNTANNILGVGQCFGCRGYFGALGQARAELLCRMLGRGVLALTPAIVDMLRASFVRMTEEQIDAALELLQPEKRPALAAEVENLRPRG